MFFYCATLCVTAVFAVARSVRLYVRYVGVLYPDEEILSIDSSPIILVFDPQAPSAGGGRKIHGGWKNLRFSTEITICLGNGTR